MRTSIDPGLRALAAARELFLTAEPVPPDRVRPSILASWWRSRERNVAADNIHLDYVSSPDLDTPLTYSAMPILRKLRDNLGDQPVSIVLTDPAGVVLARLVCDHELERQLDRVQLAPGFSYAEASVGTNGIGTALEGAGPMYVFGHEHYAEDLEMLACAGTPIHHPITGKTVGAVDLTCWQADAGPLLVSLAKTAADQIRQAMLIDGGVREVGLLQEYMRACRRTAGIVFAFNHDTVMLNGYARQVLSPADQSLLLGRATEVLSGRHAGPLRVELPSGATVRMYCRPVNADDRTAGGVVHVQPIEATQAPVVSPARLVLPGLVGSGGLWLRGCTQVDAAYAAGDWLAVTGEPGAGKLAVIRAVFQNRNPTGKLRVVDAADATGRDWLPTIQEIVATPGASLVVRHIDRLAARHADTLSTALRGAADGTWIAVTLDHDRPEPSPLLRSFPGAVEIPPLRHHVEDLAELVPHFIDRLAAHGRLTCSPEAMQLLMRSSWPGNIEQLGQVLRRVVRNRRTGVIVPDDLPPECHAVSRRLLSPLESMERDAIVQSLTDAAGNKVRAAKSLGMSRATIYRKIREYGIVAPPVPLQRTHD
jgi:transcriptional regulator of acetoin/glycerol metabolism